MLDPLRVLLVEDSEDDALLTLRALSRSYDVTHERVESADGMRAALKEKTWDIIISDYNMPRFSGSDAYLILKATELTLPFILVSGAIGEEIAVEAMRIGVDDYILKGNLARLVPAVSRELKRSEIRRRNRIAEDALRKSESRFKRLVYSNIIGVTLNDDKGNVLDANDAFLKMVGHTREELGAGLMKWDKMSPPEDHFFRKLIGEECAKMGAVPPVEKVLLCKDGSRVPMLIGMAKLDEPDDQSICVHIDLTERKRAEEERDRFFTTSTDLLCIAGADGYFKRLNPAFEKTFGFTVTEFLAKPFSEFVHSDDVVKTAGEVEKLATGQSTVAFENRYRCKDGTYRWLSWNASQYDGRIYAVARDVTDQRKAAESLKLAAHMQEAVSALGQFALQGATLASLYERAVHLSAEMFGSEFCGLFRLLPDGKALQLQSSVGWSNEVVGLRMPMGESHGGYTLAMKQPVLFEDLSVETRFAPHKSLIEAGIVSGVSVIIRGVDNLYGVLALHSMERKRFGPKEESFLQAVANVVAAAVERNQFEAQLNTSDRMATVGQMASGVAHEVNNPLSYVITNLDMITSDCESMDAARYSENRMLHLKMLKEAQEGIERVRVIVRDLTTFARTTEDRVECIAIEDVIESSVRMTASQIKHRAKVVKQIGAAPLVMGNEGRLAQVILNLLINASQAIPEGEPGKNEIRIGLKTDQSGNAVLEIGDTGAGIPEDVLPSIFDPFFTTKPIGVGTGLGLSICRNIVLKMQGDLKVESRVGVGTTVRIVLPPAANQTRAAPIINVSKSGTIAGRALRLKILLLDDERQFIESIALGLSKSHEAVITTSPLEALAMVTGEKYRFDVIFCDLMMEEMTGMEFYEELRHRMPGLESRVIFMTGGVFTERARLFLETVPNLKLAKPFSLGEIRALLQTDLTAKPT